jgi:hypothetical protein
MSGEDRPGIIHSETRISAAAHAPWINATLRASAGRAVRACADGAMRVTESMPTATNASFCKILISPSLHQGSTPARVATQTLHQCEDDGRTRDPQLNINLGFLNRMMMRPCRDRFSCANELRRRRARAANLTSPIALCRDPIQGDPAQPQNEK